MSTIETKSAISIENPVKRTNSAEVKDNAKEIEDGELPEEGEITDDDEVESKNHQAENNKPQPAETATTQQSQKQHDRRSEYHSKSSGRDSGSWRKCEYFLKYQNK